MLGVHVSRVKSVALDAWTNEQVAAMRAMGNERAAKIYEGNLPSDFQRPQSDGSLQAFVRDKYERKRWYAEPAEKERCKTHNKNDILVVAPEKSAFDDLESIFDDEGTLVDQCDDSSRDPQSTAAGGGGMFKATTEQQEIRKSRKDTAPASKISYADVASILQLYNQK